MNTEGNAASEGMTVAITGAASQLGSSLIALLEDDARVGRILCLDVKPPPTARAKCRVHEVDLTGPNVEERVAELLARDRADTLVHLAFLSSPAAMTTWAHELEGAGTMHVLNACRRSSVRKIVLRSHTTLYGARPSNPNFLSEDHPLCARGDEGFFADKIEAEKQALRFAEERPGRLVTVLRMAPILGPTTQTYLTRYLSRRVVPRVLGYDPLLQFVHESDAVAALKIAVDRDVPGVFNIVGEGVLPVSTVVKLAGRAAVLVPMGVLRLATDALWLTQTGEAPSSFLDYLKYLCVADGARAHAQMGFSPVYSTREALIDFASAQHLRDANRYTENPHV